MIRITFLSVLCFLMASPADLFAQVQPYRNPFYPYASSADPRYRRHLREEAVDMVGPEAREFVESEGDEAAAAIRACSKPVGMMLAAFYSSGEMSKLPRPRALLSVIAQPDNGSTVAFFAIRHAGELNDSDKFDAFLLEPLEYSLGLKQLATGAAEVQARRRNPATIIRTFWAGLSDHEKMGTAAVAGLVIVGFVVWRRGRRINRTRS